MKMSVKPDKQDLRYVNNMLKQASKKTVKFANNATRRVAIVFLRAAAKRTAPGKSSKVGKMAKKHRIRPVVPLTLTKQAQIGSFWYKDTRSDKLFSTRAPIGSRSLGQSFATSLPGVDGFDGRIKPIKRAIKAWSKKKKRFVYIGTELSRGMHEGNRQTRIPAAGAGKAAWSYGIRALNGGNVDVGKIRKNTAKTTVRKGNDPSIVHINKVDYVGKTSPGVVRESMNVTANYLRAAEKRRYEKLVKSEFKVSLKT